MADERVSAVKNGDKGAFEELLASFEPLIFSQTLKLLANAPDFSGEAEELRQEGRLALYDAAISYKEDQGVTFGLYAKICVRNRLVSYLRKLISKKRRAERAALRVKDTTSETEELFLAYEQSTELKKFITAEATELEKRVLALYIQKKSYAEIAAELGISSKSVDNAIYRVKTRIKKYFL